MPAIDDVVGGADHDRDIAVEVAFGVRVRMATMSSRETPTLRANR